MSGTRLHYWGWGGGSDTQVSDSAAHIMRNRSRRNGLGLAEVQLRGLGRSKVPVQLGPLHNAGGGDALRAVPVASTVNVLDLLELLLAFGTACP